MIPQVNTKNAGDAWRSAFDLQKPEVLEQARNLKLPQDKLVEFLKTTQSTPTR